MVCLKDKQRRGEKRSLSSRGAEDEFSLDFYKLDGA